MLAVAQGWLDAIRSRHPDERIYTFWDYFRNAFGRNAGLAAPRSSPCLSPAVATAPDGSRRRSGGARLGEGERSCAGRIELAEAAARAAAPVELPQTSSPLDAVGPLISQQRRRSRAATGVGQAMAGIWSSWLPRLDNVADAFPKQGERHRRAMRYRTLRRVGLVLAHDAKGLLCGHRHVRR